MLLTLWQHGWHSAKESLICGISSLLHSLNPSTSFCSLSSWFTSFCASPHHSYLLCAHHLGPITPSVFHSRLCLSQILSSIVILFPLYCLQGSWTCTEQIVQWRLFALCFFIIRSVSSSNNVSLWPRRHYCYTATLSYYVIHLNDSFVLCPKTCAECAQQWIICQSDR